MVVVIHPLSCLYRKFRDLWQVRALRCRGHDDREFSSRKRLSRRTKQETRCTIRYSILVRLHIEPELGRDTPEWPLADVPDEERKTVTALFADIKGSMDLMEELDPEEGRARSSIRLCA